ncbi:unnamed protein product, partial [Pipistrellus nathusii]
MASVREEPKPGDLIEIFRTGYQHWALYVGDGCVIHLAPPDGFSGAGSPSVLSVLSSRGMVKKQRLKDVVGDCPYKVNNHLDQEYTPLPVNKIIRSAEKMVGKQLAYDVLDRNCEHFVTDLRYGKARSRQVRPSLGAPSPSGALLGVGATRM